MQVPCPFFLPSQAIARASDFRFHLPLVDEYDGSCAARNGVTVEPALRLRACNLGAADMGCPTLRERCGCAPVILRFHLLARTAENALTVLVVHEQDHRPLRSETVTVRPNLTEDQEATESDPFGRQLAAFCRSVTRRLSS